VLFLPVIGVQFAVRGRLIVRFVERVSVVDFPMVRIVFGRGWGAPPMRRELLLTFRSDRRNVTSSNVTSLFRDIRATLCRYAARGGILPVSGRKEESCGGMGAWWLLISEGDKVTSACAVIDDTVMVKNSRWTPCQEEGEALICSLTKRGILSIARTEINLHITMMEGYRSPFNKEKYIVSVINFLSRSNFRFKVQQPAEQAKDED
jgi:hypothetical protein